MAPSPASSTTCATCRRRVRLPEGEGRPGEPRSAGGVRKDVSGDRCALLSLGWGAQCSDPACRREVWRSCQRLLPFLYVGRLGPGDSSPAKLWTGDAKPMLSQFSASGLHHPPCHGGGAIWPGVPEPSAAGKQQKTQLKETGCPVTSRSVGLY